MGYHSAFPTGSFHLAQYLSQIQSLLDKQYGKIQEDDETTSKSELAIVDFYQKK